MSSTLSYAQHWIERAWSEMGQNFEANLVPVSRFDRLEVDDMAFPFKNVALESWCLKDGVLVKDPSAKIVRVPFIAFSVDDKENTMNIQVHWAGRCGYGFEIVFEEHGSVLNQKMRWIS
ncbi:hypothetical protein [Chitinimonas sp. JJ19]|uniref:hypothetical protein n=1 Tax=Chitinimonas sp. JJ19 TaxID=3109352 RepID=UPI003002D386